MAPNWAQFYTPGLVLWLPANTHKSRDHTANPASDVPPLT